jgi:hypothetical protein
MRVFERWYFGLCWNLRLVIRVITSWRIWFLLEDFLKLIFLHVEILFEFWSFFFCFQILFNVNGKAIVLWHTPCLFIILVWVFFWVAIMCDRPPMASFSNFLVLWKKTVKKRVFLSESIGHQSVKNSHLHSRIFYCNNNNSCQSFAFHSSCWRWQQAMHVQTDKQLKTSNKTKQTQIQRLIKGEN